MPYPVPLLQRCAEWTRNECMHTALQALLWIGQHAICVIWVHEGLGTQTPPPPSLSHQASGEPLAGHYRACQGVLLAILLQLSRCWGGHREGKARRAASGLASRMSNNSAMYVAYSHSSHRMDLAALRVAELPKNARVSCQQRRYERGSASSFAYMTDVGDSEP